MKYRSLLLAVLPLSAPLAQATLTIQESFSYTTGSSLNSQNGGTGFSAAWAATTSPTISSINSSLTYPVSSPLTSSGAHVVGPAAGASTAATRNLATGAQMSLATNGLGFYSSSLVTISEIGQTITIGFSDATPNIRWTYGINATGNFYASVAPDSASQIATTSFTAIPGTTYLVVSYIRNNTDPSGYDEVFIKVYASTDTVIAPANDNSWDARASGNSGVILNRLRVNMTNTATGGTMGLDEIRVGTTFLDVTGVIPEPSHALLSGLALTLGLVRRKRPE